MSRHELPGIDPEYQTFAWMVNTMAADPSRFPVTSDTPPNVRNALRLMAQQGLSAVTPEIVRQTEGRIDYGDNTLRSDPTKTTQGHFMNPQNTQSSISFRRSK